MWFPEEGASLRRMVDDFMREAEVPALGGPLAGILAPHAGYMYSGKVAGHAFRAVREAAARAGEGPETVVLLGFGHRGSFRGVAFMDGHAFETPLGRIRLDRDAVELLTSGSRILRPDYAPHVGEHSAENEVPFIQAALPAADLAIGIMGDQDAATVAETVERLTALARTRRTLVVASSDMLHDESYERVRRADRHSLKLLCEMDEAGLRAGWSAAHQTFCGLGPVLALVGFARAQGCTAGQVLCYRNSGDDYPESRGQWVVGYSAVAFAAPAAG